MQLRKPLIVAVAGLSLGLAFDRLFDEARLGLNAFVFMALIIVALAVTLYAERRQVLRSNLWLFASLLFFSAMIAVRTNFFVTFLNFSAVFLLLTFCAVYLSRRPLHLVDTVGYALAPFLAGFMSLLRGGQVTRWVAVSGSGATRSPGRRSWAPFLRGVLLAGPIVLVFGVLLVSADTLFANLLDRLMPDDIAELFGRLLGHGVVVLVAGFILTGALAYTAWRDNESARAGLSFAEMGLRPFVGITESVIVLGAVNLLFLVFVAVQVPYLFGGMLNISVEGFTYAEYARRGFAELVAVSLLVLSLLLFLGAFGQRARGRQEMVFNLLSTLMVLLTLVMLVSAFKRLSLYEAAYGFTEMRIYPHVFMVWLGLLLGWFLVTLWWLPGRFAIGLVVACMGFLASLNVLNVDDFIVRQNTRRYAELGSAAFAGDALRSAPDRIDASYLTGLSDDAIPALVENAGALPGDQRQIVEAYLFERYNQFVSEEHRVSWPAFHLARSRARWSVRLWHDSPG